MFKKLRLLLRSTRLRYIMSYMLIMAVLLSAIGVYMYSYYSRTVYESTLSGETGLMYQIKYLCDSYMNLMEISSLRLSALDEANLEEEASRLRITPDGGEIVCVSGSKEAENLVFEEASPESVTSYPAVLPMQTVYNGGVPGEYATFIYEIPQSGRQLICLLPSDSLRLATENEDLSLRSRYILFDGMIAASSAGFSMDASQVTRAVPVSNGEHSEIRRVNGREYLFTYIESSLDSAAYVSVLTLTRIRSNALGVFMGFAAFLLLIGLPCLGFMLFISRQNLKPIVELSRRFGSNGGDEISSIDRGIKDLEGENAALSGMVSDSLPARRHLFAKQLIQGFAGTREDAIRKGAELEIDIAKAYMCIILAGRANTGLTSEDLLAIAPEGASACDMEMLERSQLLVIAFADDPRLLDAYAADVSALEAITKAGQPVAVSNIHDSLESLPDAFLEAGAAYESRFIMGSSRLLRFSSIPVSGKDMPANAKYISRIKDALSKGDDTSLDQCLNELTLYLKGGDMTLFAFRRLYNDIISAVAEEAGPELGTGMYDLFSLSECSSLDDLDSILRSVCSKVIASRVKSGAASPVQALTKMLSERYTDSDFSVADAAEQLGIPVARLTGEFKSDMGMTPADYLTTLRMEQAKKLLSDTDLPVRDIASGSGYADASSFTRRFKVYTGTTPLQYRQAAKNGELLDT